MNQKMKGKKCTYAPIGCSEINSYSLECQVTADVLPADDTA